MRFYCASPLAYASEIDVVDADHSAGGYALNARYELDEGVFGPGRVAIALIADATGSDEKALKYHEAFRNRVILPLQNTEWELSEEDIKQEIMDIERMQPRDESGRSKAGRRV